LEKETKKKLIGILDYNCGNINSLKSIIKSLGYSAFISKYKKELSSADLIILPGVGNFSYAMNNLKKTKIIKFIKEYSNSKPIIGICLGMQILFTQGNETKKTKGLDLIKGEVKKFKNNKCKIGWDTCRNKKNFSKNLINKEEFYYFNHSFYASTDTNYILSYSLFEKQKYAAIVKKNKIIGFQFHPEKSQFNGKKLLKNSIDLLLND
tara:strand:- start:8857 stop:9480 length:624 start_codon:yes stop_codon:yes gene_type:complete